jgi:two-component system chemotaxis response regulator CheY
MIRELLKEIAVEAGWEIAGEAGDGDESIAQFEALRPDAVTLDLVMPVHDGLHALRGIRAIDPDARVVVISAISQADVLKEALSLGASDFIVKPFRRSDTLSALRLLAARTSDTCQQAMASGGTNQ